MGWKVLFTQQIRRSDVESSNDGGFGLFFVPESVAEELRHR
jgi:hypothetical protein